MASSDPINLLNFVFANGRQADELMRRLVEERFYFTKIDSSGLVFQEQTVCLLIGIHNQQMNRLIRVVQEACPPHQEFVPVQLLPPAGLPPLPMIEARIGGALVYSVEVERFIQI